jgi:predicted phage gp36 major capsid-like protein
MMKQTLDHQLSIQASQREAQITQEFLKDIQEMKKHVSSFKDDLRQREHQRRFQQRDLACAYDERMSQDASQRELRKPDPTESQRALVAAMEFET